MGEAEADEEAAVVRAAKAEVVAAVVEREGAMVAARGGARTGVRRVQPPVVETARTTAVQGRAE